MLVVIVPLVLLLAQLASWYQWRPVESGESAIVELQIGRDHWQKYQHAQLQAPDGINVEAGPMRDVGRLTVFWRIRPEASSSDRSRTQQLQWEVDGEFVEKRLVTSDDSGLLSPVNPLRAGPSWWDRVLYPLEPGLPADSPVQGIAVHYVDRENSILGWNVPWWLTFLIVSMIAAFAVKPLVKVRF